MGAKALAAYISSIELVYSLDIRYRFYMPQILLNVSGVQKELWVAAAHDERVSLSEWIRRRCDAGLEEGVRAAGDISSPVAAAPSSSPSNPGRTRPPSSEQPGTAGSFKPDFKKGASK